MFLPYEKISLISQNLADKMKDGKMTDNRINKTMFISLPFSTQQPYKKFTA